MPRTSTAALTSALVLMAGLASGCNEYDYFRLTGFEQETFSNQADILFVVDNSSSMTAESNALALNFSEFINEFADESLTRPDNPQLSDDVDRFIDYVSDRTGNVNYHLGVTVTDVTNRIGDYEGWGELRGRPKVVRKLDDDPATTFTENFLCDAACIDRLPSGVDISCPGGPPRNQYCTSSAYEEGLEAVFMAMCRAVEEPPPECFQDWWQDTSDGSGVPVIQDTPLDPKDPEIGRMEYFGNNDVGSNSAWLRPNSTVIPVIITDEGDQSRRIGPRDGTVAPYDALFAAFPNRMTWAVIGPSNDEGCNTSGAADWGIKRYQRMVVESNGSYIPISRPNGSGGCEDADFGEALAQVGDLLRSLVRSFPLAALPDEETIVVEVAGRVVEQAEATYDSYLDLVRYDNGWSYRQSDNSVVLHGDAVPDFNESVNIWYLPVDGVPRELPF